MCAIESKLFNPMKPGPWILLTLLAVLHLPRAVASENSIAFLGPKGSYSDQAASDYASRAESSGTTPLGTIAQIAQSVRDGRVQYGLLPFDNSIGGFVGETHRLLLATQDPGWHVIAEVTLSISNNLLVKPGTRASDLRKIISHPSALRESTNWLKANFPQSPQEGVNSTAAAAEAVAKGDGTIAAIASAAAANVYQLKVLFPDIQDDKRNATTFLIAEAARRDFLEQHPTRLIVRLDSSQDDDALTRVVEALHRLSFTLTNVDSGSTGKLGSYRFALVFDSKSDADLEQIQSTLRPTSASLIGDLPPIASIAIGTPEKAFVLALRRSEDDHGPLLNLFSILTILTVETEMNREPQWMTLPPTPVLGQPGAGVGKRLSGDRHRQPRAWAEFT
jgi:prephenate dehydratase